MNDRQLSVALVVGNFCILLVCLVLFGLFEANGHDVPHTVIYVAGQSAGFLFGLVIDLKSGGLVGRRETERQRPPGPVSPQPHIGPQD